MSWASSWAFFSQPHLVTLVATRVKTAVSNRYDPTGRIRAFRSNFVI
jgi:hypothetical protein